MNVKTLTVFTPAYNRAHTIGRTYESLCRQTCKDFEWLVIDDGSTDNTKELVQSWIQENKIPIRYIYQENQGMHGAHNTAYRNITTELNTCIDSDDYMPDDAVEQIVSFWKEKGNEKYAGIIGLDISSKDKRVIGTDFSFDLKETKLGEYYQKGGRGDKKLVYRTSVINQYPPYPVFSGEKYFGLGFKYQLIDQDYSLLVLNKALVIVDYQEDGSSRNMYRQYWNNPKGFAFMRKQDMKYNKSIKRKIESCIHYVASSIRAKNGRFIQESPLPLLTVLCVIPGVLWYLKIKYNVKNNVRYELSNKNS